jgi:hypothetical protein
MEQSNSFITVSEILKKINTRGEMEDFFKTFGMKYNLHQDSTFLLTLATIPSTSFRYLRIRKRH